MIQTWEHQAGEEARMPYKGIEKLKLKAKQLLLHSIVKLKM
jgi:hypothetical protein